MEKKSFPQFDLELHDEVAVATLQLSSVIDHEEVKQMGEDLMAVQEKYDDRHFLISFKAVQAVSSAAMGKLITLKRRLERVDKRLALCEMDPAVAELFSSSRLDGYFSIFPDQASATEWLLNPPASPEDQ